MELISGIEFTTSWPEAELPKEDENVDLLGYFFDAEQPTFEAFTQQTLDDIFTRIADCCARLTDAGYPVSMTEILEENPRYAGVMQMLISIERKKYAANRASAIRLLEPHWQSVRNPRFTIFSVIEQLHQAGGIAVLAHPTLVNPQGERLTSAWLRKLVDAGLDGIEIYHYRLNAEDRAYFLGLAREYNLVISGGCDLHGWRFGFSGLGEQPVNAGMVDAMRTRSQLWRNRFLE